MAHILIIEDEVQILKNIATILSISGYQCTTAGSGKEALEVIVNISPQLILCDVMMNDMNGFEVLQSVKENPATQHIPFVFLTARADVIDIENGLSLGAVAYITKPFTVQNLVQTVSKYISHPHF